MENPPQRLRAWSVSMQEIEPAFFLGNLTAASTPDLLQEHCISCIVQCLACSDQAPHWSFVEYHYVPVNDLPEENIVRHLPAAVRFIHSRLQQNSGVLVHCAAGVSRSSTVVIAYIMARDGLDFEHAKNYVKTRRKCISPNEGFAAQLQALKLRQVQAWLARLR